MIKQFFKILESIGKENRVKSFILLIILLFVIILEILNFSLIIPLLSVVFDSGKNDIKILKYFENYLGSNFESVLILGILFVSILIFKIFLLLLFEYTTQKYCREINIDIALKAYSYFLYSSWQEIFKTEHAYMIRNILGDTGTFVQQGLMKFIEIFKNTFLLFFITGYLFFVNFKATFLIFFLFSAFVIIFVLFFKKLFLKLSEMTVTLERLRLKYVHEPIINLRDIKIKGSANYFLNLFKENEKKISKLIITNAILSKLPRYILELMLVIFIILVLLYFDLKSISINEILPILGLYAFAAIRMIPIFVVYNQSIQAIKMSKYQIEEVIKNTNRYSEIYKEKKLIKKNNQFNKIDLKTNLEIKISNLSFFYSKDNYIFKNVNLKLNQDYTTYIEGPNGSGKSTFVDLISGMLKPSNGQIFINNNNFNLSSDIWKKNIGYVSQTNFLINASIKENITFGRKDISENNIERVVKLVEIDKLIESLPEGLKTKTGNLGSSLSGGQKQKISIARALVTNPKVIIFDEATNAFDLDGEKKFLELIDKIKKDRLVIFIAHSNTIKNFCDIKFKIEDKKIIKYEKKS